MSPQMRSITTNGARLAFGALSLMALAACTTLEGTNAFADVRTFEREVMTSTARGVGLVPGEAPKALPEERSPLAIPSNTQALPPVQASSGTAVAAAPAATAPASQRSLSLPPERYYAVAGDRDRVCQNAQGQMVALADPTCPPEIRRALAAARVQAPAAQFGTSSNMNTSVAR